MGRNDMKILTYNVRGLNNRVKRNNIFKWIKDNKWDIIFLQETFCTKKLESILCKDWGGICYNNITTSSHSRGVSILFNCKVGLKILNVHKDKDSRKILINLEIAGVPYTLVNIYAPNGEMERVKFYKRALKWIKQYCEYENNIIICGDLNCCLEDHDRMPRTHINDKSRRILRELITGLKIKDMWTHMKQKQTGFTFTDKRIGTKSRLDYILGSCNGCFIPRKIKTIQPIDNHHGDHRCVEGTFMLNSNTRGKGYWKLNAQILEDLKYKEGVVNILNDVHGEFRGIQSHRIKWELIKCRIKQFTIFTCINRVDKQKKARINLQNKIDNFRKKQDISWDDETEHELNIASITLRNLYSEETNGAYVRSRVKWIEKGEQSHGYFKKMEASHQTYNTIKSLKNAEDEIVYDDIKILDVARDFYSTLYSTNSIDKDTITQYLNDIQIPTLNENDKRTLESDITLEELGDAVKCLKINKSPGTDGLTPEFYKCFWENLKYHFVDMMNEVFNEGELPASCRRSILSLIFKKNDTNDIKNYRPISLTNYDYKVITFVLAKRLKPVLNTIINKNQSGYITGRFIGNSIRLIKDIFEWTESNDKQGAIICCDFQKAFDSIEWDFIYQVMEKFNFGKNFQRWVKIIYRNPEIVIKNNGWISSMFSMTRGIRQGCPLSALLFILCVEILAQKVRMSDDITGFQFGNVIFKVIQYADDTTLVLRDLESVINALEILNEFSQVSGLVLNKNKCEGILLGGLKGTLQELNGIKFTNNPIKCLGIYFGHDKIKCNELNWLPKLKRLEAQIESWKTRNLTIFGKIELIKALGISQFVYQMTVLEVDHDTIKRMEKMLFGFIWNSIDRIKRKTIIGEITRGGLDMVDVESKILSLKASWISRLMDIDNDNIAILNYYLKQYGITFEYLLDGCFTDTKDLKKFKIPSFYVEMLCAFHKCKSGMPNNTNYILNQPLWFNKNIYTKNNVICYTNWAKSGILYIKDCINLEGRIFSPQECLNKLRNKTNWMVEYLFLKINLKQLLQNRDLSSAPFMNNVQNACCINTLKGVYNVIQMKTKIYYNIMVLSKFEKPISQIRWQHVDNMRLESDWQNIYITKIRNIPDRKLSQFNFKLLHNIIPCRRDLYKWNKINSQLCIYCGENETLIHVYYECKYVNIIWRSIGSILNTNIQWKHIVLGIIGNNNQINFRNMLYSVTAYALYKKWNKYVDNNVMYPIGNEHIIDIKNTVLPDLYKWNSILKNIKHPISNIHQLWKKIITNILSLQTHILTRDM